ncbi:two-component system, NarL family, sensor histidine kinase ComP [Amphibacillus marinus]|uniref:histidine kinase n=1 Tax=Amphibacillus marinus TaxID=872970 RepID=A0A1H8Q8C1_9BACI|nr:ATP-binding protein [Amphibacillus marinus]SEO50184.1 two-component system, NarL family, sensor histidine kinase ComP [Amphibacillus marinus]
MKRFLQRLKSHRLLVIFFISIILIHMYLLINNFQPLIGINLTQENDQHYRITSFDRLGWGRTSGLAVNDQVIYVNNQSVEAFTTVQTHNRIEGAQTITVDRIGQLYVYEVSYHSDLFYQYIFYLLLPLLFFLFCLLTSFILYQRNPDQKSAQLLIIMSLLISLAYNSSSLANKLFFSAEVIMVSVLLLSPCFFFHFVYLLFTEKKKNWFTVKLVYFLYAVATIAVVSVLLNWQTIQSDQITSPFFSIIMLIIFFQLFRGAYLLRFDPAIDSIYGILLSIGLAISPFLFLYTIPQVLFGLQFIYVEVSNVFLFFIPAGFLYLIVSDQLYLLKIKIKQLPYYLMLAFFLAISMTIMHVSFISEVFNPRQIVQFFVYTFLTGLLLLFLKKQLDYYFRLQLFVSQENYQASLYRFSEAIKMEKSKDQIVAAAQREIREVLNTVHIEIAELHEPVFSNEALQGLRPIFIPLIRTYQGQPLVMGKIYNRNELCAISINQKNEQPLVFFLALNKGLRREQLDWLSSLAQFTNLALENQLKIDDLLAELEQIKFSGDMSWLSKLLFHWSENERRTLAQDIHDSFLQDLIVLKRNIEGIKDIKRADQKNKQLEAVEQDIQDMVYDVRETCMFLYPTIIEEIGLIEALQELAAKFRLQSNSVLDFKITIHEHRTYSKDVKMAVYRIVQEWLNNARKHAKANHVKIDLQERSGELCCQYIDDGVGIASGGWPTSYHNMGLLSIKERVRSLQGHVSLDTKEKQGVRMIVTLPYQEGE